jgi:hypothetical protein
MISFDNEDIKIETSKKGMYEIDPFKGGYN